MLCRHFFVIGLVLSLASSRASAHFLFVRITPPAEAGRAVEVYFSELAQAGDPQFIGKIAHTRLWAQTKPGDFRPLTAIRGADRLRAPLPGSGSLAVIGACEYGVLSRKKPFLLRHFPKAMAGKPEDLNRMEPFGNVPLEIVAKIGAEGLRLVALRDGKPLAGAEFHLAGDPKDLAMKAGADGSITWTPPAAGHHSIYISSITPKPGKFMGKNYEEIRDFATLAFAWPLGPSAADPKAVALFQEAVATRARWRDFPGFSAHVTGKLDGRPFAGNVAIAADGSVTVNMADEAAKSWVQEQLESIVLHRGAGNTSRATGKSQPVIRFADAETDHPLGRLLVFEGGRFASSYRIKDKQIMVVNRHLGKENMTITVLDNDRNPEGQFLPRSYTVQYWDAGSGSLTRIETIQERWQRVGLVDLPATHTVTIGNGAGLAVRSFTLSKHALTKK